ncbi:MAG: mRNA surveillance protein pelota [Candidatus Diapherotrites archaeon]|nr:mRNA surveillance protein pelota [Candidatus Diapherotrites archaeon]
MRVVRQDLPRMILVPESLDDLWHLEKVVDKGDLVTAEGERRFKTEDGQSERKKVRVKIRVEEVDFHKHSDKLRLLGTIIEGRPEEYVSIGSHHTIEIMPGTKFSIEKSEWYSFQLNRIKEAVAASRRPKLIIAVMDDEGTELALLREFTIERKGSIRSGKSGKDYEQKSVEAEYFHRVAEALNAAECEKIVLAGPGFTKESFMKFVKERLPGLAGKIIVEDIGSSGHAGVQEVLKRGIVERVSKQNRVAVETCAVEKLLREVSSGELAAYGTEEVEEALDYGAAEELLLTDEFFSENRDKAEHLLSRAELIKAKICIISTEHDAGRQLQALGGIAALLRFKMR